MDWRSGGSFRWASLILEVSDTRKTADFFWLRIHLEFEYEVVCVDYVIAELEAIENVRRCSEMIRDLFLGMVQEQ